MFPRPDFFAGALLNFAENLLFPENANVSGSDVAVITATETEAQPIATSWADLREEVRRGSNALRAAGVGTDDVVAGFVANHASALVAMLSVAAVGAIWTGISPDNGVSAVLDRLAQVRPKVLFADNASVYNGTSWSSADKTSQIVEDLVSKGLELVVVIESVERVVLKLNDLRETGVLAEEYDSFLNR